MIMTTITSNLQAVRAEINLAVNQSGRHLDEVTLLAVSKNCTITMLQDAYQAGQHCFAESYVQEAIEKITALRSLPIEWHFIGPIQSNKTRLIAENFSWVHSVDSEKVALRLASQRPSNLAPLQVCLQVNTSGEISKRGVSPSEIGELACKIALMANLKLRGLMSIPAIYQNATLQHAAFARLRNLRDQLNAQGLSLDTLSMGMSGDYPVAIAEGATFVRVGTAIFGSRL
jgi:pyridoxal phosphate enzyme (YggS family)